ncbi:MAG: PepSY-associated TM helix domain-containing protein [Bacteroidia bacterium]|nr:PepSY-associated TM helix domain-containing protein [Bacteroidia bacterium]
MQSRFRIRNIIIDWHRDIGYFISVLIIVYCISGIALNHIDDFNPDFIIQRDTLIIPHQYQLENCDNYTAQQISALIHESKIKVWDKPTADQIKIYYDNATLHIYIKERKGIYEQLSKRPIIYHSNLFHRNSIKGWKWISDIFATLLIIVTVTGLFMLKQKNKNSLFQKGKWYVIAGTILPFIFLIYFIFFQK